jgi:type II secretory pathway component PulF
LRAGIREGNSLAAALSAAPVAFPPLVLGLVEAGEAGSGLAAAVVRAAEFTESAAETRRALHAALAYPLVLAGAGTASVILLVGYVLPRFATILADLGQGLPRSARLVLHVTELVRAGWLPGLAAFAAVAVVWRAWTASPTGRVQWHTFLLALPVVGEVRRAGAVGRFAAALGALLQSGVPIAPALTSAVRASGDTEIARRVGVAREAVLGGSGLASALAGAGAATPTAVRLIRAGEESGRVVPMLDQVARIESGRAEARVRTIVRVLEPALILVFGGIVAVVAAALLQAVYSVRPGG